MDRYYLKDGSEVTVRLARREDLPKIAAIYESARAFMRANGNMQQWSDGSPSYADSEKDIENKLLYTVCKGDDICAVFCCIHSPDPTYNVIYDGKWSDEGAYYAVHRIAAAEEYRRCGAASVCCDFALSLCGSVRIDTHKDNIPMQRFLLSRGFTYCGIIHLANGDPRLAYQKTPS